MAKQASTVPLIVVLSHSDINVNRYPISRYEIQVCEAMLLYLPLSGVYIAVS